MRRTAHIMGMPVSLDIPGTDKPAIFEAIFEDLRAVDEQFSPYKPNSELSRFRRSELSPDELSIGMNAVMKACLEAEKVTDGYFSAMHSGQFDPTGYVKGWAIKEASRSLKDKGITTFCLGVGGDINARSNSSKTWGIGVQDPRDKESIIGKIEGKNIAVATSGNYERGQHIINPKTGKPAKQLLSLTVAGPDIAAADVLATAAFVMGMPGLQMIDEQTPRYEVLAIDKAGKIFLSSGMKNLLKRV